MSVCDTKVVDAIGVEDASGKVILTVSDHLEWNEGHLPLLQDKLNTYIAFIESGELLVAYPDAKGRQPVIDVVCQHEPNHDAETFFIQVRSALEAADVEFRHRVLSVR